MHMLNSFNIIVHHVNAGLTFQPQLHYSYYNLDLVTYSPYAKITIKNVV